MALQTSGAISLNQIHVEAGGTSGTQASLNDSDIRGLTPASGKTLNTTSQSQIDFNNFYGASVSLNDFNSFSYVTERANQSGTSLTQTNLDSDASLAIAVGTVQFRLYLTSNVLYYQVRKGSGGNVVLYDGNSSGVQDGTTTTAYSTSTWVNMGSISVNSPVDVKINWAYSLSGSASGTGNLSGNTSSTGATYSLSDNTYQTLTNGQSAGWVSSITASNSSLGTAYRYLNISSMALTLQKTGFNTTEVADFDAQFSSAATITSGGGGGGCPLCCIHEDVLLDTTQGPMSIHDMNNVQVYSWNYEKQEKEAVDIEEVVLVERDCVYKVNNLLLTEDHIIFLEDGTSVAVNPEEVMKGHGKHAEQLKLGQAMKTLTGVEEITFIEKYSGLHKVYALRTKNNNFYANGILVDAYL